MADNLNPFLNEISIQLTEAEDSSNDYSHQQKLQAHPAKMDGGDISWDSIAAKLLRDNYTLTALELYTEFIESGRELPRLRDYFSNPGNFERTKEDTPSPPTLRNIINHISY